MATSDRTERQDDSALAERATTSRVAHLRVVFGIEMLVRNVGPSGIVVGRAADDGKPADLTLQDTRMSRRHACVERHSSSWRLVDLGSRNGIYLDGALVAPQATAALRDGAVIRLGDSIVVFREEAAAPPESHTSPFPGDSPLAARVRAQIARLATSSGHVLVLGETGTGKERAARTIAREAQTFVPQNCAELVRELSRSELFGHLRGAFSGAATAKPGLVEIADGGVLFLDEVGELAVDVQGDLLRFLEDGSYRPIGATELRHSKARIVAATNVDLDAAVQRGAFRRDLLARLRASNAPLELPPLRERREDILPWVAYFLREAGAAVTWTAGAAECLLLYPWPENLRELRGLIRALGASDPQRPLTSEALPDKLQAHRRGLRRGAEPVVVPRIVVDPSAEDIVGALVRTSGRMRAASEELGIERTKLYRLCQQHGIDFESYRASTREDD